MSLIDTTPIVSIIVPVYNAANSIERTIDSVQRQSMCDWELILIDDGSIDNSAEICKGLTYDDRRIKYYYQENSGPASARNKGIKLSHGKYLAFLDADDTYSIDFLERQTIAAETYCAEMVICGFNKVSGNKQLEVRQPFGNTILNGDTIYKEYLTLFYRGNPGGIASLCNKLYLKEFIQSNGIRLDETMIHGEDWKFNIEFVCAKPRTIVAIDHQLYNYFDTIGSITKTFRSEKSLQMFRSGSLLLDVNERFNLKCETCVYRDIIQGLISNAIGIIDSGESNGYEHVRQLVQHPMSQYAYKIIDKTDISFKMRILANLLQSKFGFVIFSMISKLR